MDLDTYIAVVGNVATVLSLCFANPVERGCVDKWRAPGKQLEACRIEARSIRIESKGDRLACHVIDLDRDLARLFLAAPIK